MASKDSKTSKTARVMNLLSKKSDAAPQEGAETAAPEQAAPSSAPVPPVITSMAPDAAASDQIKSALELAFEEELEKLGETPADEPVPAPAEEAVPEPEPLPDPEPVPEAEAPAAEPPAEELPPEAPELPPEQSEPPAEEELPQPPVQEPLLQTPLEEITEMAETGEHHWIIPESPTSPGYINVMQVLVEEKAPKYIKLFGLCQCSRCLEDVKALTLNHLPPKYVVLEQGDMIPRLTVYEGKYSSDITAQLLHACRVVMDRPHHSR